MQQAKLNFLCILFVFALIYNVSTVQAEEFPQNKLEFMNADTLVVELVKDNFTSVLQSYDKDTWFLIEFYASWCPHCRHFRPQYDKVANFFNNKTNTPQPRIVVARLDCAYEGSVCNDMHVKGYPTMYFGKDGDFLDNIKVLSDLQHLLKDYKIVEFLEKKLDVKYNYQQNHVDEAAAKDAAKVAEDARAKAEINAEQIARTAYKQGSLKEEPIGIDLYDVERGTEQSFFEIATNRPLTKGSGYRDALISWLTLLKTSHPIDGCMSGASKILSQIDVLWPPGNDTAATNELAQQEICGHPFHTTTEPWRMCQGSRSNTRGYTCSLWSLFHALAVKLPESDTSGLVWRDGIRAYALNFFTCKVCAQHFAEQINQTDAMGIQSKQDAVMWSWEVHNRVNARLAVEEATGAHTDLKFPKAQWPTPYQCPKCRTQIIIAQRSELVELNGVKWNKTAVYDYITAYYGSTRVFDSDFAKNRAQNEPEPELDLQSNKVPSPVRKRSPMFSLLGCLTLLGVAFFTVRQLRLKSTQKWLQRKLNNLKRGRGRVAKRLGAKPARRYELPY